MCVFVLDPGANTSTFGLLKNRGRQYWWPRVHEFLEISILVHFMSALVQPTMGIVGNVA
jgi:hypothetical protein